MKRVLLMLLVVCTLFTILPVGTAVMADDETDTNTQTNVQLPMYTTLVGTEHLPPISNQGNIGSCASSSITYMQFTNAVSRYLHSIDPDIEWNPSSGDARYIFSPKYTYNFAGSGTAWVYNILMENGCMTWDQSQFRVNSDGSYNQYGTNPSKVSTQSSSWDVNEGDMESALNYRLTNFEQIWLRTSDDSYGVNGKIQITNTEKGQALIRKIKEALVQGNVVVTGGLSSVWTYEDKAVVRDTPMAKKNDAVLYCGRGEMAGGHQVCIVGYDDSVVAEVTNKNGGKTTLRGAFLMANSWGTGYQNDGYVWLMYDALNQVSEEEELNFSDRQYPMDQFCFVYWDKDITTDKPDLMLEVELEGTNRQNLSVTLMSRPIGASGGERTYLPILFDYASHHGDFADKLDYNYAGEAAGKAAPATFTFACDRLYLANRGGNLQYGVKITTKNGETATVKSLTLKNGYGQVISQLTVSEADGKVEGSKEYFLDGVKMVNSSDLPKNVDGATLNALSGTIYFPEGSDYSFTIDVEDATKMAKVTLDGAEVTPDADGVYTVKLYRDNDMTVELVDKPVEPTDDGSDGSENKKSNGGSTTMIIVISVVAVVVVGGVVAVVIGKKKKA